MADEVKIRLSATQIVGGAVAAMAAAVAASFLGVYGTIIGAAVMSAVSTAGTVLYEQTVSRSKNKLTALRSGDETSRRRIPSLAAVRARLRALVARPGWWKTVGAASLGVFALTIGTVTAIEAGVGKPMAAVVTGKHSTAATSLRAATRGGDSKPAPARPDAKQRPGQPGQDGVGNGSDDRSPPADQQPPPATAAPEQDTPRTGQTQEQSVEPTPQPTPTPAPTSAPEEQDPLQAPTPQPTQPR